MTGEAFKAMNGKWVYIAGRNFGSRVFCWNGTLYELDSWLIQNGSGFPFRPVDARDIVTSVSLIDNPSPTELVLSDHFFTNVFTNAAAS